MARTAGMGSALAEPGTLAALPSGKAAKVSISSANDAGEGPQSPQVDVAVP